MADSPARRWILTIVVAAALVVAAVFAAKAIRDDGTDTAARHRTTTTASTSTSAPSTTSTTAAPSTTGAGTTTSSAPTSTTGPPGPCGTATGAIRTAVDAAVSGAAQSADVASCRLAASDPSWAAVKLDAKPGAQFDAVTVVLHGGGGAWSVVAQGGPGAGCGQAPQQVIVDLGQFCAGTGGGGAQ
jgi:hypothetical protein